ncbi:TetR family transcriptional regulator [Secundilactobacillus pentosiphilus]|uniref:TetR family transcriptional regulator n=1 Tax=Secundilactobacillus pentosiphilus TaxID=1714682 RepID=A0A1Z5IL77_9LACO|nr:TetR/AcrR family transcriptional regulator [Secundilactobacillus pentosiphilus]GAX02456.1 TetR family transcriptional regulator [Secundilactobacillus pentosiphilus]
MVEDLRIIKTKRNIENAFLELLTVKDFEKITVKEITEHSLTGKTTFYYHYADKYDLAQKIIDKASLEYSKLLKQRIVLENTDKSLDNLHKISKKFLLLRKIHFAEISVDKMMKNILADILMEQLSPDIDHLTARLLSGFIFECLLAYGDGDFQQTSKEINRSINYMQKLLLNEFK